MKNPHVLPGFQMVSTPNQLAIQDQRRRNIAKKEATEKEAPVPQVFGSIFQFLTDFFGGCHTITTWDVWGGKLFGEL